MLIKIDDFKNLHKTFGAQILECFTVKQLRGLAKKFDIPVGKTKADVIKNISAQSQRIDKIIRVEIYSGNSTSYY